LVSIEATNIGPKEQDEQLYCYGHPTTPTRLLCSRCERPICGRCAIPASVGQHCPECVAAARKSAPKVRTVLAATAPATRAILILTGAVFLAQLFVPGLTSRLGAAPLAMANGEWWRFLTPMVVHAGAFHFIMNAYVLFAIGPAVEQRYGPVRFVIIYVMAGLGGSIASFAFNDAGILGVGASGAILGLIGALMADLYQRKDSPNAQMQLAGMWRWLGFIFGIGIAFQVLAELGILFFRIDNFAHAGGLILGAAVGYGLGTAQGKRPATGLPVAMAVVIFFAGLAFWRIAELSFG
jgi:membrane associated rhomboid family serine protease